MTDEVLSSLRDEMSGTIDAMRRDLSRTRTGRASTALLEGISVDYYGAKTPLPQTASVGAPEARLDARHGPRSIRVGPAGRLGQVPFRMNSRSAGHDGAATCSRVNPAAQGES